MEYIKDNKYSRNNIRSSHAMNLEDLSFEDISRYNMSRLKKGIIDLNLDNFIRYFDKVYHDKGCQAFEIYIQNKVYSFDYKNGRVLFKVTDNRGLNYYYDTKYSDYDISKKRKSIKDKDNNISISSVVRDINGSISEEITIKGDIDFILKNYYNIEDTIVDREHNIVTAFIDVDKDDLLINYSNLFIGDIKFNNISSISYNDYLKNKYKELYKDLYICYMYILACYKSHNISSDRINNILNNYCNIEEKYRTDNLLDTDNNIKFRSKVKQ